MVNCCVIGFKSRSERKIENISFHTFPKDEKVRDVWIKATGRRYFKPSGNTRICSKHFESRSFRRTRHRVFLDQLALPKLFVQDSVFEVVDKKAQTVQQDDNVMIVSTHITDETNKDLKRSSGVVESCSQQQDDKVPSTSQPSEIITPRKKKLITQLKKKSLLADSRKKKIAVLKSRTRRLQKKNSKLCDIISNLQSKFLINQETADLLASENAQNNDFLKPGKSKFSKQVRKFALQLHFISPRAYNFVRDNFNTCLPHTRTLARWYQSIDCEPGFTKESFRALSLLVKNNPSKEYKCCLIFDEMAIRKSVQWDGKNYIGFVNIGQYLDSDVQPIAKEVLVFMLTSINGSWKLPVGYFLIDKVSAEQKASLVKICLDMINECGLEVVNITFDGCPANFAMAKVLGCQIDGDDEINPIFIYKDKKISIFPDPSHMLKLVRNILGEKLTLSDSEGQIISWEYIQNLVKLQESEGFHVANKLKEAHIHYKSQIMKVKLAAQLLSASVGDAIEFCKENLKIEEFNNSEATVHFIRLFNNLFDIMNSRNLNSYGFKKPLNSENHETIKQYLEKLFDYIKNLKIDDKKIIDTNRKTGCKGFLICIRTVLFLYDELILNGSLDFLCTYKLSQDHIEIFFSAIRAKGGFNNNPTATQFKSAYKRLLMHGELKHLAGNCVPLSDISILTHNNPEIAINCTTDRNRLIEDDKDIQESLETEIIIPEDHDYIANPTRLTEFSKSIIVYIAGFVVKSLKNQLKCEDCLSYLITSEKNETTLQFKKDKGGLHYPSISVVKLCEIAEHVFKKFKIIKKCNTIDFLLQECVKKCVGINLFSSHDNSNNHFVTNHHYVLLIKSICKKYLNVRIHYYTKHMINKGKNVRNLYNKLILFKGQ